MVKRSDQPRKYRVWLEPEVYQERNRLPGNIRQRVKPEIEHLSELPRPSSSRVLDITELGVPNEIEIRRIRLQSWRIIYAIHDVESWVWVLAIHQRPPYNYEDLDKIVSKLG
jgi:mRNA-degrading endonuclease RelE of RelBE toxin-antitoxin system